MTHTLTVKTIQMRDKITMLKYDSHVTFKTSVWTACTAALGHTKWTMPNILTWKFPALVTYIQAERPIIISSSLQNARSRTDSRFGNKISVLKKLNMSQTIFLIFFLLQFPLLTSFREEGGKAEWVETLEHASDLVDVPVNS
jgi:hypothetical protein